MNKKPYHAPVVARVELEVREAVLGTCRLSGVSTGRTEGSPCTIAVLPNPACLD